MNKCLSLIVLCSLVVIVGEIEAAKKPAVAFAPARGPQSIDAIDRRLTQLESDMAGYAARLEQLRQDSARVAAEWAGSAASRTSTLTSLDASRSQKNSDIVSYRSQRNQARQDSLTLAAQHKAQTADLSRQIAALEQRIGAAASETDALSRQSAALAADNGSAGAQAVAGLQAQLVDAESQMKQRQVDIQALQKKRDAARQDFLGRLKPG